MSRILLKFVSFLLKNPVFYKILFVCFFVENSQADMLHVFQMQNKVTFLYPTTNILSKSVIFIPTKEREKERTVGIFKVSFFLLYKSLR